MSLAAPGRIPKSLAKSSSYEDPVDRPLFGERRPVDRVLNLIVGAFTALMVLATLISSIALPSWPPKGINIFFAGIIVFICASHLLLIFWYREGDLEPKFRSMIFYNAFGIILLCVCANLFIYDVSF